MIKIGELNSLVVVFFFFFSLGVFGHGGDIGLMPLFVMVIMSAPGIARSSSIF